MTPNDPQITWVEEPKLGLAGRMYLPLFFQGLTTTARHLVSQKVTVQFPEERPTIGNPLIYRGVHLYQLAVVEQHSSQQAIIFSSIAGFIIGSIKGKFVLTKTARKNMARIDSLASPLKLHHVFSKPFLSF